MDERQRNIFERLAGLIPGYDGFADKEKRRTADQALRHYLGRRIDELKRGVDDVSRELVQAGTLDGLDQLDRLKQRLGTCADTLRNAPYGESGWTDDWVVTADDLSKVYEHDQALDAKVDETTVALAGLKPDTVGEALEPAREKVDELRQAIEQRDVLLSEVSRCRS